MRKLLLTILLLSLTGCIRHETGTLVAKEKILGGIDDSVKSINEIVIKDGVLKVENTDDNTDETFIIKSDKARYSLSDNKLDVILGITNTRDAEYGVIKLKYSKDEKIVFAGTYSTTTEIKIIENYQDVEVACPTKSASSTCYTNELVSTTSKEIIVDSWTSINLAKASDKTSILQKETIGKYDANEIRFYFPKGTTFIKITLEAVSTLTFKDEFYVEVFGENGGYGMLDPLIDNATSYWAFDESSGNATDSVNSYVLTNYGTAAFNSGLIGNGGDLGTTNTSKYFKSTSNGGITTWSSSYTINFWVKLRTEIQSADNLFIFITQYPGGAAGARGSNVVLYEYNGGTRRLSFSRYHNEPEDNDAFTYNLTMGTSDWYMITITYDGTNLKGYVNTDSAGSVASDTSGGSGAYASAGIDLGSWAGGFPASAIFDEMGFWTRVLSSSELTSLYNSGNGFAYPFSSGTTVISQESDLIVFEE